MSLVKLARPILKRILPARVRQMIHEYNIRRRDGKLSSLGRAEVFDAVYQQSLWGGTRDQSSGWGSYGEHAEAYIQFVREFIKSRDIQSIVDIGCGDFHIGSRICDAVPEYIAGDVSKIIVERNQVSFKGIQNVQFVQLDVCTDRLPIADLITIREVLQHLSNSDIALALENIRKSGARFVLITEHLPSPERLRIANIDKPRGPNIRNPFGSGVYIDRDPFNCPAVPILQVRHPSYAGSPSHLVTYLWELSRPELLERARSTFAG